MGTCFRRRLLAGLPGRGILSLPPKSVSSESFWCDVGDIIYERFKALEYGFERIERSKEARVETLGRAFVVCAVSLLLAGGGAPCPPCVTGGCVGSGGLTPGTSKTLPTSGHGTPSPSPVSCMKQSPCSRSLHSSVSQFF